MPENIIDNVWVHNCETTREMGLLSKRLPPTFIYAYVTDIHLIIESTDLPKTLISALLQLHNEILVFSLSDVQVTDYAVLVNMMNCVKIV